MKILWLSENGFEGKIPRDFKQMRTEFSWFCASDGYHTNIGNLLNIKDNSYDIAIIILPKREDILYQISPYRGFDLIGQMKRVATKIGWMQEGPITYFHDYSIGIQTWFFSVLTEMDFLMVHNEKDKLYLNGLIPSMNIFVNRSLMIHDAIPNSLTDTKDKKYATIGGNLTSWYGGFNSYMVALEFGVDIYAPSMGRMKKEELNIQGLLHIPYMSWQKWMERLSTFKYAVHMMPVAAAGTFSLNCACLGIPCIGNKDIDTQQICHSSLSVDVNTEIDKARELARRLSTDKKFYEKCSIQTKELYNKYYVEEIWKENFFNFLEHI